MFFPLLSFFFSLFCFICKKSTIWLADSFCPAVDVAPVLQLLLRVNLHFSGTISCQKPVRPPDISRWQFTQERTWKVSGAHDFLMGLADQLSALMGPFFPYLLAFQGYKIRLIRKIKNWCNHRFQHKLQKMRILIWVHLKWNQGEWQWHLIPSQVIFFFIVVKCT